MWMVKALDRECVQSRAALCEPMQQNRVIGGHLFAYCIFSIPPCTPEEKGFFIFHHRRELPQGSRLLLEPQFADGLTAPPQEAEQ